MKTREQIIADNAEYRRLLQEAKQEHQSGNLESAAITLAVAELHREECGIIQTSKAECKMFYVTCPHGKHDF